MTGANPCLGCGACCAHFRASFYWAEADDVSAGGVPAELTEKMNDFRRAMKGMSGKDPRCVALAGSVGKDAACSIHDKRSSVCRDFEASWSGGTHNPRCDEARQRWGLRPLRPEDWASGGPG